MAMPLLMYRIYIECARKEAKLSCCGCNDICTQCSSLFSTSLCACTFTDAHIGIRATTHGSHPVNTGIHMRVLCMFVCVPAYAMTMILFFRWLKFTPAVAYIHIHITKYIIRSKRMIRKTQHTQRDRVHMHPKQENVRITMWRKKRQTVVFPRLSIRKCDLMCIWGKAQHEFWVVNNNNDEPER